MKTRAEYDKALPGWELNRAAIAGQDAVRAAGDTLLPRPAPHDESIENKQRYASYLSRAVFYPVASRTVTGMAGLAMANPPTIELPPELEHLLECADGAGASCSAMTSEAITELISVGRMGILSDHASGVVTEADDGGPVLIPYRAEQILSWFEVMEAGRPKLVHLVLAETHQELADGEVKDIPQRRVLSLEQGLYVMRVFQKPDAGDFVQVGDDILPTDGQGQRLDFIPWSWGGAVKNDSRLDKPVISDIARMNVAHYVDSADFQESVYLLGQPMVALTGLTQAWADKFFQDQIYLGIRQVMLLPEGGSLDIKQAAENTLAEKAMQMKEAQMAALGAMLITGGGSAKTAEQIRTETAATQSALEMVVQNASDMIQLAISHANVFTRSVADFVFEMKPDLRTRQLDAQLILAIVQAWQQGALSVMDRNEMFRSLGMIDPEKTDDEIDEEIRANVL